MLAPLLVRPAAGDDGSLPARARPGAPTVKILRPELATGAGPVRMRTPAVRILRTLIQFRPQVEGRGVVPDPRRIWRRNRAKPATPVWLRGDAA
jgi:hypothetical protein